jgi:hypothetical protein
MRPIHHSEWQMVYSGAEVPFDDMEDGRLGDVLVKAMGKIAEYMRDHGCTRVWELEMIPPKVVPGRSSYYVCVAAAVA